MDRVRVGTFPPLDLPARGAKAMREYAEAAADAGFDHLCTGDHVSFFVGAGFDGLLSAAMLLAAQDTMAVHTGVYLLPLRHPVLVARQLADLASFAPGRFVFGVGVGGEDPHEVVICGVDPKTRGRRMDDCLTIVRGLLAGDSVTHHGDFFDVDDAIIRPTPAEPVRIVIGGRSDAAVRRAGRLGDGWLGVWVSDRRFAEVVAQVEAEAAAAGRTDHPAQHGLQVWCGIADGADEARALLAPAMEGFYGIPFERFEKYSPAGTPADVAAFLRPYVDAGCRSFNLIPQTADPTAAIEGPAEVRRLLTTG